MGCLPRHEVAAVTEQERADVVVEDQRGQAIEVGSDGKVRLPDRPGLGVRLNAATVEKYRI